MKNPVVLVVVIVVAIAAIGITLWQMRPPSVVTSGESSEDIMEAKRTMKCAECGHTEQRSQQEVQDKGSDKFLEDKEVAKGEMSVRLYKCPGCEKFAFGFVQKKGDEERVTWEAMDTFDEGVPVKQK